MLRFVVPSSHPRVAGSLAAWRCTAGDGRAHGPRRRPQRAPLHTRAAHGAQSVCATRWGPKRGYRRSGSLSLAKAHNTQTNPNPHERAPRRPAARRPGDTRNTATAQGRNVDGPQTTHSGRRQYSREAHATLTHLHIPESCERGPKPQPSRPRAITIPASVSHRHRPRHPKCRCGGGSQ